MPEPVEKTPATPVVREITEKEVEALKPDPIEDKRPLTWQLRNKLTEAGFKKAQSHRKPQKRSRRGHKNSEGGNNLRTKPRRRRKPMDQQTQTSTDNGQSTPNAAAGPNTQPTPGVSVSATSGLGRTALHTAVAVGVAAVIVTPLTLVCIRQAKKPLPLEDAS